MKHPELIVLTLSFCTGMWMAITIVSLLREPLQAPALCETNLWIIGTASIAGGDVRQFQYTQAIASVDRALQEPAIKEAFPDWCRHVIYVENNGGPTSYLDSAMSSANGTTFRVLYTRSNLELNHTSNKGLREHADLIQVLSHVPIQDRDWVVKLTGRYRIQPNAALLRAVAADVACNRYDAMYRPGAYYQRNVPAALLNKLDCVTGFLAMRAWVWRAYGAAYNIPRLVQENPTEPFEWFTARHIQSTVTPQRIKLMESLGAAIAPGSDEYYVM